VPHAVGKGIYCTPQDIQCLQRRPLQAPKDEYTRSTRRNQREVRVEYREQRFEGATIMTSSISTSTQTE
jgi:hypothetical protein